MIIIIGSSIVTIHSAEAITSTSSQSSILLVHYSVIFPLPPGIPVCIKAALNINSVSIMLLLISLKNIGYLKEEAIQETIF